MKQKVHIKSVCGFTCVSLSTVGETLSISLLMMWIIPLDATTSDWMTIPFFLLPWIRILVSWKRTVRWCHSSEWLKVWSEELFVSVSHPLRCVGLSWFSCQSVKDVTFLQSVKGHHPGHQVHLTQVFSFGRVSCQSPHLVNKHTTLKFLIQAFILC